MERISPPKPRRKQDALCQTARPTPERRDFDRQVAEFQLCVAILNGFTELGMATRYDRTDESFLGFIDITSIRRRQPPAQ